MKGSTIRAAVPGHATEAEKTSFVKGIRGSRRVGAILTDVRSRLLSLAPVESLDKNGPTKAPRRWVAHFFDYSNNRLVSVEANFPSGSRTEVSVTRGIHLPTEEEWQEAIELLRRDKRFGPLLERGSLEPFHPMPPLSERQEPTGEVERTLHVGLQPRGRARARPQIMAVNLIRQQVSVFDTGAPPGITPADAECTAPPQVGCQILTSGPPGQCWISWPSANPLWTFLAIRPSASSGASGSGIELRSVDYQGKRVLYQAHVPIVNVLYEPGGCGSFRDWLTSEVCFDATGTDIAPGFRWCTTPPKTICESNKDGGNYNGVAIYEDGGELVLTSVMAAGWYRYIQEWRFNPFGIIRARFKFAATGEYCVCNPHTHHAYWRFDFDVTTWWDNLVEEFNDPPIIAGTNWHKKTYEIKRYRDYTRKRKWRVSNTSSGESYHIIPRPDDGVADAYGKGDLWVLRYHGGSEIDDSSVWAGDAANLDAFVNGELVENQDLVVWYGAHFLHDIAHTGAECHTVGPDIVPAACVVDEVARGTRLAGGLDDLRQFRDYDLRRSVRGSRLLELLERNEPELVVIIQGDERLRSEAAGVLGDAIEVVRSRRDRNPRVFDDELLARADRLLAAASDRGSQRLRADSGAARKELERFRGRSVSDALAD